MWKTCHGDIVQILASYMITFIQISEITPRKVVLIICLHFKYKI